MRLDFIAFNPWKQDSFINCNCTLYLRPTQYCTLANNLTWTTSWQKCNKFICVCICFLKSVGLLLFVHFQMAFCALRMHANALTSHVDFLQLQPNFKFFLYFKLVRSSNLQHIQLCTPTVNHAAIDAHGKSSRYWSQVSLHPWFLLLCLCLVASMQNHFMSACALVIIPLQVWRSVAN